MLASQQLTHAIDQGHLKEYVDVEYLWVHSRKRLSTQLGASTYLFVGPDLVCEVGGVLDGALLLAKHPEEPVVAEALLPREGGAPDVDAVA